MLPEPEWPEHPSHATDQLHLLKTLHSKVTETQSETRASLSRSDFVKVVTLVKSETAGPGRPGPAHGGSTDLFSQPVSSPFHSRRPGESTYFEASRVTRHGPQFHILTIP